MDRNSNGSELMINKTVTEVSTEPHCKISIKKIIIFIIISLLLISIIFFFVWLFNDNETRCETEKIINTTCPVNASYIYNSELSDYFTSELDNNKWLNFNPTFLGRSSANFLFSKNNVEVRHGCLRLTARNLRESEKNTENFERNFTKYATSIVKSKNKFLYGYFEIRAKTMKANVCNAFWLYDPLSDNLTAKFSYGEKSEEIDIFEVTSGKDYGNSSINNSKTLFNTVHVYNTPYLEAVVNREKEIIDNYTNSTKVDFNFSDDFHRYGFLWTEEKLEWYFDGEVSFSRENNGTFNRSLHVTFDSEIMKDWFGIPDPDDLPAEFLIDYFRYWNISNK